jgi:hypothetical protein
VRVTIKNNNDKKLGGTYFYAMTKLSKAKALIEKLPPDDQRELANWLRLRSLGKAIPPLPETRTAVAAPARMNRKLLPGFRLNRIPMGWKGKFPGRPKLFDRPVLLIAETQEVGDFSKLPPPVSHLQAALVQEIQQGLTPILKKAKKEVETIGIEPDDDGKKPFVNIYVWLHYANDDGKSWEFVVERADGDDLEYHLAYQGTRFIEVWAGD